MRRVFVFASFVLILPVFATAQHRGGTVAAPAQRAAVPAHPVASATPHAAAHISTGTRVGTAPVGGHRGQFNGTTNHNGNRRSTGITNLPAFSTDFADSPGLGFDFPHLAAVSGRQNHGRFAGTAPIGFSGFLLSPPLVIVEEGQPQPVDNQEPAVQEAAAMTAVDTENVRRAEKQYRAEPSLPPAPQHDAAEYVFVRRDGGLVFAVAYSWEKGTLRYVTRDGLRRSITRDALDMDATQQFNEQRGLNFRLPV